jgi:hypothetical protein
MKSGLSATPKRRRAHCPHDTVQHIVGSALVELGRLDLRYRLPTAVGKQKPHRMSGQPWPPKEPQKWFLYFGYASTMLNERLLARTHGSRKCDMETTGDAANRVEGVLFWIDRSEKPTLDEAEALGHGYDETTVDVITDAGTKEALAYVASATDAARRPYHWFKALVVAGAIQHRLPVDYTVGLRAVPSQADPLPRRRTKLEAEAALAASGVVVD